MLGELIRHLSQQLDLAMLAAQLANEEFIAGSEVDPLANMEKLVPDVVEVVERLT